MHIICNAIIHTISCILPSPGEISYIWRNETVLIPDTGSPSRETSILQRDFLISKTCYPSKKTSLAELFLPEKLPLSKYISFSHRDLLPPDFLFSEISSTQIFSSFQRISPFRETYFVQKDVVLLEKFLPLK